MPEIRMLLADDDQDDRMLFEDALEDLGYPTQLTLAKNGVELLDILLSKDRPQPEILFLDLNMPLKNGEECLNEIRARKIFDDLIIVIYSTSLNQDTVDRLYSNDADYYIQKPSDYEDLKKVIKIILDLRTKKRKNPLHITNFVITPS